MTDPPNAANESPGIPAQHQIWDSGLQPERTKLAWQRTVLSLLACSLVVSRLVALDHLFVGVCCALTSVLLAGLAGRRTTIRYRRTHRALRSTGRLPDGRFAIWLVLHLLVLGAFAVLYALS